MSLHDFEIIKELGKGAFGIVYLIKRKKDNTIYALKQVKITKMEKKEKMSSLNEIRLLASISHQNIIAYKESFYDEKNETLNLILEYANGGDLHSKIKEHKSTKSYFKEKTIWSIFIQMLIGLKNLHEHNIMHRDLKSANIFLMKNGIVKLGDLNVAKILKNELLYSQTGTPYYASPEVWSNQPYNFKSDIWSLGCILYELCSLKLPFKGNNFKEVYNNVINCFYEQIPNFYSNELKFIVNWLLQVNPVKRPNCFQLINCDIIKRNFENIFGLKIEKIDNYKEYNDELLKTFHYINDNDIKYILPKNKNYGSERIFISKNNDKMKNKIVEDIKDTSYMGDIKKNKNAPKSTNRVKRNYSYQKMNPIHTEQRNNQLINCSNNNNDKNIYHKNINSSHNVEIEDNYNKQLFQRKLIKNNSFANGNKIGLRNPNLPINLQYNILMKDELNKEKINLNLVRSKLKNINRLKKNHSLYNIKTKIRAKNKRNNTPTENKINKTIEKIHTLNNNSTLNSIRKNTFSNVNEKEKENYTTLINKKVIKSSTRENIKVPICLKNYNNIENSTPMKNQLYSILSTNSNTKKSILNSPSLHSQNNVIYNKEDIKMSLKYPPKPYNLITDKNLIDKNFSPERNSAGNVYNGNCFLESYNKRNMGQRAYSFVNKNIETSEMDPFKKMLINPIKIIEHKNMKIKKDLLPNHIKVLKLQNSEIIYLFVFYLLNLLFFYSFFYIVFINTKILEKQ